VTARRITADGTAVRELVGVSRDANVEAEALFQVPLSRLVELAALADDHVDVTRLTYSIQGTMIRLDAVGAEAEDGYALVDFGSGTLRLVQPFERVYVEWTRDDLEELKTVLPGLEDAGDSVVSAPDVEPLGETREVNGMPCAVYRIDWVATTTRACVTTALGDLVDAFRQFESRMQTLRLLDPERDEPELILLLADEGFPILEQSLYREETYGTVRYEVSEITRVDRRELADTLFEVPADFERRGILDLLRGR